jgi:Flp pilus assembly protein TadD
LSSSATATAIEPATVSRPPARLFISREKRSTVLCLLLALATLAVYNSVVHNGFTNLDDDFYIVQNPHVWAGLSWDTVKWAFTSYDAANWHPLTWLSHAFDFQLFKMNAAGHHYVSVLLHAANVVLLFLLLESATGFTWRSLMVAALFALHPVNVESVAWAAERKNVLSMLFFLLTMHAYGWYVRRGGLKRYSAVAGLFALGLMAKPEIITLPFVLLLWDYWPLRRMSGGSVLSSQLSSQFSFQLSSQFSSQFSGIGEKSSENISTAGAPVARSFWFLILEKVPLLLLAAGSAVITLLAQHSGDAIRSLGQYSARARLGNVVVAYVRYVGKAFWPVRLSAFYPHPGNALPNWEILASAAVLLLLTAMVLHWRNRRYLAVGWFWFLGTLVPVIGMVQVGEQAMADRYAYLSFIGLFVCMVWGVADVARERKIPPAWLAAPAIFVLIVLGVLSQRQIAVWHNSETLWRHAITLTPSNYRAHDGLARALAKEGRSEDAIAEFKAAQKLSEYNASSVLDLGVYEQLHGHIQEAAQQFERSANEAPDSKSRSVALSCLGLAFMQMGDLGRARMSYGEALRQNPDSGAALVGSGLLAERSGDFASATSRIFHAVEVEPTDVHYLLLGQVLRRAGRAAEADEAVAHAQKNSKDFSRAQQSAAQVLAAAGIKAD